MYRFVQTGALLLLLVLGASTALASPQDNFRKAQQAFKAGQYEKALEWFRKARRAGLENVAIYYNLGVTYYRLGRYSEAEKAFLATARYPKMAPLAWYNLGLVKRQQGDKKTAVAWFRKASKGTRDPKLRKLAADRLAELHSRWRGFASAGIGYDDNITLLNDVINIPSGRADSFVELYANTRGILSGTIRDGLLLKAGAFADLYTSLSQYDYNEFNIGLYKTRPLAKWATESGLRLSRSNYGGRGYLQILGLELRAKRTLSPGTRLQMRLRVRDLQAVDNVYDYLSGSSYDLRVGARWRQGPNDTLRVYYQYQDNDRNDRFIDAANFRSVSPQRHRVRVTWRHKLTPDWKLRLAAEYRISRYRTDNLEAGVPIRRKDDRLRGLFEASRKLNRQTDLVFSYHYTDNSSSISRYDYQRNVLMASVQYTFE
jgi:tetratricopeptide (TPR) repeat protein